MTNNYVTLFDSLFLPQGLALHESLEKYGGNYVLWILCVDDTAYEVLEKLNLCNVHLIKLSDVETQELKQVKQQRTKGEYCWTLTPFAPRFVFETDGSVDSVSYIDADLWFRKSPQPIFDLFHESGKSVLITDHGYAPEYDQSATSGRFCVQFIIFKKGSSEALRKWWEEKCIDWCYARFEDGRFGDQMYLDQWSELFPDDVYILPYHQWTLAPWNVTRFPYSSSIFYHFHGLRILSNHRLFLCNYPLPRCVVKYVYEPYIESLRRAITKLNIVGFVTSSQKQESCFISALKSIKMLISGIFKQIWRFNIINYKSF